MEARGSLRRLHEDAGDYQSDYYDFRSLPEHPRNARLATPPPLPSLPNWAAQPSAPNARLPEDFPRYPLTLVDSMDSDPHLRGGRWEKPLNKFMKTKLPKMEDEPQHRVPTPIPSASRYPSLDSRDEWKPPRTNQSEAESQHSLAEDDAPNDNKADQTPYFKPWKKSLQTPEQDDNLDSCEGMSVNKWKQRALVDPFAKRKQARASSSTYQSRSPKQSPMNSPLPLREKVATPTDRSKQILSPLPTPTLPTEDSAPSSRPQSSRGKVKLESLSSDRFHRALNLSQSIENALPSPSQRLSQSKLKPLPVDHSASNQLSEPDALADALETRPKKPLKPIKPPPKPPKSTMEALEEIKRKREARRSKQVKEKERQKREIRQHGDDTNYKFRRLVEDYRKSLSSRRLHGDGKTLTESICVDDTPRLSVFVRKRPLASKEVKAKEYDIVSCLYTRECPSRHSLPQELIVHEPKWKVDCSEALENHSFLFDGVFDEQQSNDEVYHATLQPLLPSLLASTSTPTNLTVFAYGQTGSGKTFTMQSLSRQGIAELFDRVRAAESSPEVLVSYFEIYQNHVLDLLSNRKRVQMREDGDGQVQIAGITETTVTDSEELLSLVHKGEGARATSANAVHDESSRSHALLRITLVAKGDVVGRLAMVDLAGSERASETQTDSKSTRREGAEINKSLLALKECVRAMDLGAAHVPFRQSKLTQLLRDSFRKTDNASDYSRVVLVATVSPAAAMANNTLNTLRYAQRLKDAGNR